MEDRAKLEALSRKAEQTVASLNEGPADREHLLALERCSGTLGLVVHQPWRAKNWLQLDSQAARLIILGIRSWVRSSYRQTFITLLI